MKILSLLTDAFGGYGGIATYNRDFLQAVCTHRQVHSVTALPRAITQEMQSLPTGLDYKTKASAGAVAFLKAVVAEAFRGDRPDIIYCGHINLAPFALALKARWRTPVLVALWGYEAWLPTGRAAANRAVKYADAYYAISGFTKARFVEWSGVDPRRIELLPNAIHLERYGPGAPSQELCERLKLNGRKVLLTLGRIVSKERAKGFDEVLDVLPEICHFEPKILYVIAGDGNYRPTLEAKVQAMGLCDYVRFTGFVSEEVKVDLYRAADVFVMPSRGEGFGFVFLEAMACGTPCIASSVDGSRDAVRNGALGAIVDPDDKHALLNAIMTALQKPRAIPEGLKHFAFPAFEQRVHAIIDAMISQKGRKQ